MVVPAHPNSNLLLLVCMMALQLSRESKVVLASSTTMEVRDWHCEKAVSPMEVTFLGILIDVMPQALKPP